MGEQVDGFEVGPGPRRPGRPRSPHGTEGRWRSECRKNPSLCPGDETGKSCQEAHQATLKRPSRAPVADDTSGSEIGPEEAAEPVEVPTFDRVMAWVPAPSLSDEEAGTVERFGADYDDDGLLGEPVAVAGDSVEFHEVELEDPIPGVAVFEGRVPVEQEAAEDEEEASHQFDGVTVAEREKLRSLGREHGGLLGDLRATRYERDVALRENEHLRARIAELEGLMSGEPGRVAVQVSFEDGRLAGVRVEVPQTAA